MQIQVQIQNFQNQSPLPIGNKIKYPPQATESKPARGIVISFPFWKKVYKIKPTVIKQSDTT